VPEAGIQFQQIAEGVSQQFPYTDEPAACPLTAISAVLATERRAAIQAHFDRLKLTVNDAGVAQDTSGRLDPALELFDLRPRPIFGLARKVLLQIGVAEKK
jgi:hypothetical protein